MDKQAFKSDAIERVCFLAEASKVLASSGDANLAKVSAYYGYTGRELCLKNQVATPGWASIKRNRCVKCFACIYDGKSGKTSYKKGSLIMKCSVCDGKKKYPISDKRKTHYERLLYDATGGEKKGKQGDSKLSQQ